MQPTPIQSLISQVLKLLNMTKTTKISKAPKATKKVQRKCDAHEFSLKPVSENMIHSINLSMSFCLSNGKKTGKAKQQVCLDYPCFNPDANIATPTFILNSQKNYYSERQGKILEEHQQRMENYTDEKSSLNVPKPRTKSSYCSVCRIVYEDYLEHINTPNHHTRISVAQFNPHILQLTNRYNQTRGRPEQQQEKRNMEGNTENNDGTSDDSDQVQIISNPYKIGRRDERPIMQQNYPQPQPQQIPFSEMNQLNIFRSFSSFYQDQMNQVHHNYNMNMFMNPFFNYRPFESSSFKPCLPFSCFPYPQTNFYGPNLPYSKPITCIVIDE